MKKLLLATLALAGTGPALAYTLVGQGYTEPVFLTAPSGDASRLFIVEKGGVIKMQSGGKVTPWLDISAQVNTDSERGLLGLAFDPNYATNGRFYVDYIDKTTLATVVASYTATSQGVDKASARTILTVPQTGGFSNHKAGWIGFSPKDPGQLYIATGDGGSVNDPNNNAQNLSSNLGKLLRITPGTDGGYTVPADNPFVGAAGNDEIWAYGLRNPYRNSFDRTTGDLWIGDVGQGQREEIDFASAASGLGRGANYGWRLREGTIATPGVGGARPPGAVDPIYDYGHTVGQSVIGGYVYRGGADANLEGKYVFGDYVSGSIWALSGGSVTALDSPLNNTSGLSSFGEGGTGALYAIDIHGNIYLLAAAVPEPAPAALLAVGLMAYSLIRRRRA
ncbi:PQQ-dependent sugar dehydrogenase [Roseateles cellulosilyticus]|uniref:PQQ-dependent sugar dehydrogenase n=1 Tax=Pelomonas cellulosilytica TaxID=2906762 RepID=A0ABS8Y2D1_9BURK|nr:PQQ-dependent sugar dehydrogenase [Pelomonas sp. P8]MCE4557121.1 PQQ-dependent sugar dehydrogenase [Pelomonas sp. P8]